tara:strand:+ start:10990 stop:11430 length:441 start_codon:yes stop_codon:yes gene_type:complete
MAFVVKGLKELKHNLNKFLIDTDKAVSVAIRKTAFAVDKHAKLAIRNPSIGTYVTRYRAGGRPYSHVASKSGDAPNTDTGRLINSIAIKFTTGDHVAHVFTNLEYGFFLETVHNRPFLVPALNAEIGSFKDRVTDAVKAQIEKAKQ